MRPAAPSAGPRSRCADFEIYELLFAEVSAIVDAITTMVVPTGIVVVDALVSL